MSRHVALLCLCVLFVWSVSSTVLREDGGHQPSAETEGETGSRIIEKRSQARADEKEEGVLQLCRVAAEQLTDCSARVLDLQAKLDETKEEAEKSRRVTAEQLATCNSRTLVLQAQTEERKEGVEEIKRLCLDRLTSCNFKQYEAQQTLITSAISHRKEAEILREEVFTLKQQLEESTADLKRKSEQLERLEETKPECDLEITDSQNASQSTTSLIRRIDDVKMDLFIRSQRIFMEIISSKNKMEKGFDKLSRERLAMFTVLQSKYGEILKALTKTTKEQDSTAASIDVSDDMTLLVDKFYYFSDTTRLSWYAARDFCTARGLTLASIENEEENDRIVSHLKQLRINDMWLGGTDEEDEGTWRWTGTEANLTYINWEYNEPYGKLDENCMAMRGAGGRWKDYVCKSPLPFLCK